MVALHYLKYTHNLSDDDVVAAWVENLYWQHFSDMKYFEYKVPIHPSSMSKWRKRIGDADAQQLLHETIEAGLKLKAGYRHPAKLQSKVAATFFQQSRYAYAGQMKRAKKYTRKLKTYLGRIIRDIERKCPEPDQKLDHVFVAMGYRGHGCQGGMQVHVDKRSQGRTVKSMCTG